MSATIRHALQESSERLGLSTTSLAEQAGVSKEALEAFEAGDHDLIASVLMKLARAMGLAATAFLTDEHALAAKPALDRARFFHDANAPVLSEADVVAIMRETTRSQLFAELVKPRVRLDEYQSSKPGAKPWRQGYDLAASLRSKLGLTSEPINGVQAVIEEDFGILVAKHAFTDTRLRAVAVRAEKGRLIVVSKRLPTALLRVSLAHELCHHACDLHPNESLGESDDVNLEGFSGAEPGEEQRAKAFAVMFLAPDRLVRELFGQPTHQFQTADKALDAATLLATRCGISAIAALWHLFHLYYLSDQEADVQGWQRHLPPGMAADFERNSGDRDGLLRAIDAALVSEEIDADQAERLRNT